MRVHGLSCSVSARRALVRGCVILVGLWAFPASTAMASGNAGYSTYDSTVLGCLHGSGVNCNLYSSKDAVYMSGGPSGTGLAAGQYYFTVLAPGSQNGGFIDGADGNLSDTTPGNGGAGGGDGAANRTFTVSGGAITSYSGNHATGTGPPGRFIIGL